MCHSSSPPSSLLVTRPPSSSLLHSSSIPLSSCSPCAPAPFPSLTQGPCVPVCNISKAVRRPGQGKQPSAGFRGDGGRDVFPQEPRDPRRLLAGAREGPRGEDDPLSCPPQEHTPASLFSPSISISSLLLCVSFLLTSLSLWFYLSLSASLHTKLFNSIYLTHVHSSFMSSLTHSYTFLPTSFLCWHKRDIHMCMDLNMSDIYSMQYMVDV